MSTPSPEAATAEVARWAASTWDPDIEVGYWWDALADAGLTLAGLPDGFGGRGWPTALAKTASIALARAGVLGPPIGVGLVMAAPTILDHGDTALVDRLVPPIVRGRTAWCQLFRESGAGSDLAGLATEASREDGGWTVEGSKVDH
jgi:alkylation response protein AidB-like acyl-CoA dehydrogenase